MTPSREADQATVRARLVAERDRLLERPSTWVDLAVCGDAADRAEAGVEAAFDDAATAGERDRLAQVEHAIERLDAGTYGTCETCGGRIGRARLAAAPRAVTCVACSAAGSRG